MNSKLLFYLLSGAIFLLGIAGIAGAYYGNAFLERKTSAILELKADSLALDEQQKSLVQAKRDIEKYSELERIARTVVPQEKDQARTIREIIKLAEESNVPITNISFPSSNLGQAAAKPNAATGTTTQPAPATTTPQTTQLKPVQGIPGVYQLDVTIQSDTSSPVPYNNMLTFLSKLEQNRRTANVTNLSVTPSATNRNQVTFSLVVNIYIKP